MKSTRIFLLVAVLGMAAWTASAAELITKTSVRGRSGTATVVKVEPAKTTATIALSRQGEGIGSGEREASKHQWRNTSRPIGGSAAVVVRQ